MLRSLHLFAGIGGGLLADKIMGHEPRFAIEVDPYCCNVLRTRASEGWFPELDVIESDVRDVDTCRFAGQVDCIHAGFPCQPFSVSGTRKGFDDERGQLFFEVIRFIDGIRPRFVCLENVPAVLVSGYDTILAALAEVGYDVRWACLSAASVGAPHKRERWWALACPCGQSVAKHEPDAVSGKTRQCLRTLVQERIPWTIEPQPYPVVDGLPERVAFDDRAVKGYGNAQVPLQAAVAYAMLGLPLGFNVKAAVDAYEAL